MCIELLKFTALVATVLVFSAVTRPTHAGMIELGSGWELTAPDGYEMRPDGALHGIDAFQSRPLKQIVNNWNTLDPVFTSFVQRDSNDINVNPYFDLRMEFTNKTNAPWLGFFFMIVDGNSTLAPPQGGGNLLHPAKDHFHIHIFDEAIGFTGGMVIDPVPNDLDTRRGVYTFLVQDGFVVQPGDTWGPKFLGIHAPPKKDDDGRLITEFIVVQAPFGVPEPSTALLLGFGAVWLLVGRWARRNQLAAESGR